MVNNLHFPMVEGIELYALCLPLITKCCQIGNNKQESSALQGIISTPDLYRAYNSMPSTIDKCELFRIKHIAH